MSDGDVSTTTVQTETEENPTGQTDLLGNDNPDTGGEKPPAEGTTTETTDGAKPEDGDKGGNTDGEGSQTPPEAYADFAMPEGMQLDDALLTEATPMFKELGLTQDQAQKLVDFQAKQVQAGQQKQVDAFNQQLSDWDTAVQGDKEIGGDKFDETIKLGQAGLNAFGTPELKQLLEDYGVYRNPEIIRFMARVGKTVKEDVPGETGGVVVPEGDRVSRMYPNDRNK